MIFARLLSKSVLWNGIFPCSPPSPGGISRACYWPRSRYYFAADLTATGFCEVYIYWKLANIISASIIGRGKNALNFCEREGLAWNVSLLQHRHNNKISVTIALCIFDNIWRFADAKLRPYRLLEGRKLTKLFGALPVVFCKSATFEIRNTLNSHRCFVRATHHRWSITVQFIYLKDWAYA
jgi:hypothetical protein